MTNVPTLSRAWLALSIALAAGPILASSPFQPVRPGTRAREATPTGYQLGGATPAEAPLRLAGAAISSAPGGAVESTGVWLRASRRHTQPGVIDSINFEAQRADQRTWRMAVSSNRAALIEGQAVVVFWVPGANGGAGQTRSATVHGTLTIDFSDPRFVAFRATAESPSGAFASYAPTGVVAEGRLPRGSLSLRPLDM